MNKKSSVCAIALAISLTSIAAATPWNSSNPPTSYNGKPVITRLTRASDEMVRKQNLVYLGRRYTHGLGKTGVTFVEVYGRR